MLQRTVSQDEMAAFEKKTGISRNNFFIAVCLLTIAEIENESNVMLNWVFHDRTDRIKQNAFGCLFRNIAIGVKISGKESMKELTDEKRGSSDPGFAPGDYGQSGPCVQSFLCGKDRENSENDGEYDFKTA